MVDIQLPDPIPRDSEKL
jgi:hypothetical protein